MTATPPSPGSCHRSLAGSSRQVPPLDAASTRLIDGEADDRAGGEADVVLESVRLDAAKPAALGLLEVDDEAPLWLSGRVALSRGPSSGHGQVGARRHRVRARTGVAAPW